MTKPKCLGCANPNNDCKRCRKSFRKEQAQRVADAVALLVDSIVATEGDVGLRRNRLERELRVFAGVDSPTDSIRGKSGTAVSVDEVESMDKAIEASIAQAEEIAHWIDLMQTGQHRSTRFTLEPYQIKLLAEILLRKQTEGGKS